MTKVLLEAPILTKSGYGEHSRLVFDALRKNKNLEIMINPLRWGSTTFSLPSGAVLDSIQAFGSYVQNCKNSNKNAEFDIQIHVGIPNEFEKKAPYSVCVTAGIETDRVDPSWLIKTHQGIDKIIVPSNHAKVGFTSTNYEIQNNTNNTRSILNCACPVDVIHYPVKEVTGPSLDIDFSTDFNFLTVAMIGPRKNLELTITGFIEEFKDNENVGLIVKTNMSRNSIMDRVNTKKTIEGIVKSCGEKKCKIYLLHGDLSESEIISLYSHPKIKAYVSTTHGEGYGLPIFDAVHSGMPVVATDWSGHLDFLTGELKGKQKKLFAKIEYDLKKVPKSAVWENLITEESKWAYPKKTSYKSQISKVYKDYGMYKKWANALEQTVRKNHKLDDILDQYLVSIFGKSFAKDAETEKTIKELRDEALSIKNVKQRAKFAKKVTSGNLSQTEKIEFLKDLFKHEKAYVLSCGPTLTDHDSGKIQRLLKNNLGISIKQSFDLFGDDIDIHIYNCANFKEYDYSKNSPIVLEASTSPYKLGQCDLKFFIRERDFNKSLSVTNDFDSWTFEKQPLLRPYGPGIMYEVVFYTLQHLGISEVITIGWDNKLIEGEANQQHFYDKKGSKFEKSNFIHSNEVADNQASVNTLSHEEKITTDTMLPWYDWLKSTGIELKIVSSINPAPEEIQRIEV